MDKLDSFSARNSMLATDCNPLSHSGVAASAASHACKIGTYYIQLFHIGRKGELSEQRNLSQKSYLNQTFLGHNLNFF